VQFCGDFGLFLFCYIYGQFRPQVEFISKFRLLNKIQIPVSVVHSCRNNLRFGIFYNSFPDPTMQINFVTLDDRCL
jgi:hypothetical protein